MSNGQTIFTIIFYNNVTHTLFLLKQRVGPYFYDKWKEWVGLAACRIIINKAVAYIPFGLSGVMVCSYRYKGPA